MELRFSVSPEVQMRKPDLDSQVVQIVGPSVENMGAYQTVNVPMQEMEKTKKALRRIGVQVDK